MNEPLLAAIAGRPGPKGSLVPICLRCAKRKLPQQTILKEQSEVGMAFRKAIARYLKGHGRQPFMGATETIVTVYIERQHMVKGGVKLEGYVPSSSTPRPIHRNSGDIEKHVRVLHDALQDVHLLADDSIVTDLIARKRWADEEHPAGIEIEIRDAQL